MTKEEEARFDPDDLLDLRGSTAAKSRKMTVEQRDVMLHKRRLRNRASAARSRDKQRKTIGELGYEVDNLVHLAAAIEARCVKAESDLAQLRTAHSALQAEYDLLKHSNIQPKNTNTDLKFNSVLTQSPLMCRNPSTLRLSLSTDMLDKLDKIIGGTTDPLLPNPQDPAPMYKIPSKLHLALSTDKLPDTFLPTISSSLPPLSRNLSIIERLLDCANNNNNNNNLTSIDSNEINSPIIANKE